jgi:hypothetical protein
MHRLEVNSMRIVINRDSVCAADDMSHHIEEFIVPDDITIAGLFEFLDFKYIPFITGDNVVWALHNHEGEQGAYFTKEHKFIHGDILLSTIISDSEINNELYLRYYSDPSRYQK